MQDDNNILPRVHANITNDQAEDIFNDSLELYQTLSRRKVKLSVVIPFFRAGDIGFIPLESLARQKGVTFGWELIIMEENFDNPFGFKKIWKYANRLKKAGCVSIRYFEINSWLPLSAKWYFLFQEINKDSLVVACNSADLYMSKDRLRLQYEALKSGEYNWHKLDGNIVYDIESNKHVKLESMNRNRPDTCCASLSSELAKKLPLACVRKSVDSWRYNVLRSADIRFYYDDSDLWNGTININGLNNISVGRQGRILSVQPPFKKCCRTLDNHMPSSVVKKLRATKKYLEAHMELRINSEIRL